MKRRTDTLAQQCRIRHEYAARIAQEAWEQTNAEWARLRNTGHTLRPLGTIEATDGLGYKQYYDAYTGQKH